MPYFENKRFVKWKFYVQVYIQCDVKNKIMGKMLNPSAASSL